MGGWVEMITKRKSQIRLTDTDFKQMLTPTRIQDRTKQNLSKNGVGWGREGGGCWEGGSK